MKKKVNIFLGGYINHTNAQNLNCLSLSKYLDHSEFNIYTLTTYLGENNRRYKGIKIFHCCRPLHLSRIIGFVWGVLNCDIAYLPKHLDTPLWVLRLIKLLKKRSFTTIEGNVTDRSKPNLIDLFSSEKNMKNHFYYFDEIYGITQYLCNQASHILDVNEQPLYLGVDHSSFFLTKSNKRVLKQIVFVGSIIKRKRVEQIIVLAEHFPMLSFVIIGEGPEKVYLEGVAGKNVKFLGQLSHAAIKEVYIHSNILFLPSISEGFPKVVLEAASSGIPSIVYSDYGIKEWISHEKNGFIINEFNEVIDIINRLLIDRDLLESCSKEVVYLARKFDWEVIIKVWQKRILKICDDTKRG